MRHRHYISNGEEIFATVETNAELSDLLPPKGLLEVNQ